MRFTVRRPPAGEVSPCGHRPSGGDVACSIDVGVAPAGSAGFALENRLALTVLGCDMPACGATLRRIRSRDLLDPAVSLMLQTRGQKPPTAAADCTVEPTFLCDSHAGLLDGATRRTSHHAHVESLDPDHVKPSREFSRGLLDPVLTTIPLARFQLRDRPFRLPTAVGASLGPGKPPLEHYQPLGLTASKTRCVQQFAGGQRGRHGYSAVDADHAAVGRAIDRVGDVRERDMPATSPITGNPVRLDTVWHRTRLPKPHPPHLRHPDPTKAAVQPLNMSRLHSHLPKPFVHTGFTPSRATVRPSKEVLPV